MVFRKNGTKGMWKGLFQQNGVLEKAPYMEVTALAKAYGRECTDKLIQVQVMESGSRPGYWREKRKKPIWKGKMRPVVNIKKRGSCRKLDFRGNNF